MVGIAITALPGLDEVRARLTGADPALVVALVLSEVASCAGYVLVFRATFCSQMSWRLSGDIALAELAANSLLPAGGAGGLALGVWALRQAGMPTGHIARRTVAFFVVTSAANFFALIIVGIGVFVGILSGRGSAVLTLVPALITALGVLLAAALLRNRPPKRLPAPEGAPRILVPFQGQLDQRVLDAAIRIASAEHAVLVTAYLLIVPLRYAEDSPLRDEVQMAMPLLEAVEQMAPGEAIDLVTSHLDHARDWLRESLALADRGRSPACRSSLGIALALLLWRHEVRGAVNPRQWRSVVIRPRGQIQEALDVDHHEVEDDR